MCVRCMRRLRFIHVDIAFEFSEQSVMEFQHFRSSEYNETQQRCTVVYIWLVLRSEPVIECHDLWSTSEKRSANCVLPAIQVEGSHFFCILPWHLNIHVSVGVSNMASPVCNKLWIAELCHFVSDSPESDVTFLAVGMDQ
jgi:hypothetical protein